MDFRKFDGVVGGVEQGVIQVAAYGSAHGHRIILLSKPHKTDEVKKLFKNPLNIDHIPIRVKTHAISLKNMYLDSTKIQKIAQKEHANVIHFPYNWSFPFVNKRPTVLTIHDVIPFTFREAMGFWRNRLVYKPAIRIAARLNTVISTVSEFSKKEICEKTGVSREKVRVIPNGLRVPSQPEERDKRLLLKKYGVQNGYILNAGGIHERKNIPGLIGAFSELVKNTEYPGKLIITGSVSGAPYQEKMKAVCDKTVVETDMDDRVVFTGFVPERELDFLFKYAQLFIYPSFYEGFGIPILEAMKIGTPVVTSNITAMKEVAKDAALLIDPNDTEQIWAAMQKLLTDRELKKELVHRGKIVAKDYSWEKTGAQYLKLYSEIAQI
jgi:glycosyltransferase involved in cell wall biosynthesis